MHGGASDYMLGDLEGARAS
jgi:hypothetical protein